MKALIWILSLFVFTVLNTILGAATGFRAGSVLLYLIWFYSAQAMCNAWDKSRISKNAEKAGMRPFEYIKTQIPETVLERCEENRGDYDSLKRIVTAYTKEKLISRAYADILLEEYRLK